MTDLDDTKMTSVEPAQPGKTGLLLVTGLLVGALVTGGVVALAVALIGSGRPTAMPAPRFVEETASAGIDHHYEGDFDFFVGGGVAVFDCNDDRLPDLFLAGGTTPAAMYANTGTVGGPLGFQRIESEVTDLGSVTGAYPIDVDSDGITDLAVLRFGENVMLRGLGGCRFERVNESWGVDGGDEWTVGFSATWEGAESLPTLAFGNYLTEGGNLTATCDDSYLARPAGDAYSGRTTLAPGWCTLSILFSSWDRSGRSDLRVTNDRHYYRDGEEQLWRVEPDADPRLYTAEDGWQTMRIWGMGIASHDLNGDSYPEVFLTSQGDNKLQTLADGPEQPTYVDIALESGANAHRPFTGPDQLLPSTAWHAEFQDVNNDTYIDLFVSKGNVEEMPEFAASDPSNLLIGDGEGGFTEGAGDAGIVSFDRARGAALADFNLDGLLDLIEVNRRAPARIWRNVGSGSDDQSQPMGNWVALRLHQDAPNTDAIGAWVELDAGGQIMERELTIGGGHAGGQLGWIHFGLGDEDQARVRVLWPNGEQGPWMTVDANRFAEITRGEGSPSIWEPDA